MSESLLIVALFIPFILILLLANLADKRRLSGEDRSSLAGLAYLLHIVVFGVLTAGGVALHAFGLLFRLNDQLRTEMIGAVRESGLGSPGAIEAQLGNLEPVGIALWAPALVAPLLLLPPFRRLLARLIPIDPRSSVHAVAVSYVMLIVINLTFTLAIGLETLADISEESPTGTGSLIFSLWVQQLTFAVWALVGVGWLTRRRWLQSLERLAIVFPRPIEIAIGIGVALVLVPVILLLENLAAQYGMGVSEDVQRLSEALLGPLAGSFLGILTLGLAAGIGEETLFRGALQPRFGLLFTSILFAVVHSQYGITFSTVAVFLVGIILGLLRQRFNTTTCAITHTAYNIILGVYASYGPGF